MFDKSLNLIARYDRTASVISGIAVLVILKTNKQLNKYKIHVCSGFVQSFFCEFILDLVLFGQSCFCLVAFGMVCFGLFEFGLLWSG